MALAHGLPVTRSVSVRESEWPIESVPDAASAVGLGLEVDGTVAVIAARNRIPGLHESLAREFGDRAGLGADGLSADITVLSAQEAKGLEPAAIVAESARGAASLYVAMTRPTQRLVFAEVGQLPAGL